MDEERSKGHILVEAEIKTGQVRVGKGPLVDHLVELVAKRIFRSLLEGPHFPRGGNDEPRTHQWGRAKGVEDEDGVEGPAVRLGA